MGSLPVPAISCEKKAAKDNISIADVFTPSTSLDAND